MRELESNWPLLCNRDDGRAVELVAVQATIGVGGTRHDLSGDLPALPHASSLATGR